MDDSDSEENDLVLVEAEDVENFNLANILPLSVAELEEIRSWLQPTPYDLERSEYSRHLASHLPGTGKWLTSTTAFQEWQEGNDNGLLWIKGIPGSGKSVMAASIVDQLKKQEFPVMYFFFRQIIDANHQPIAALRDWLCQVLNYSPPLQHTLKGYIDDGRSLDSLSPNDFWRDLRLALDSLPRVYCVTDALDEMDQGNNDFLHSLAELGQWRPSKVKVLITSRPVATIGNGLRQFFMPEIRLEEHLVDTDIIAYVHCRLQHSSIPEKHWDAIKKAIPGRANGLFLYAKLSMDAFVESSADPNAVLEALPADLNVMYNDLLHEHARRSNIPDDLQLLVLQFVTHATRPLRLLEMAEMVKNLRVLDGDPSLKETKDLVRATCGPLLEILPDETISVVHHSLTEFLKGYTRSSVSDAQTYPILRPIPTNHRLASACLNYLKSINKDDLDDEFRPLHTQLRELRLRYPFLEYAATNWFIHVARAALTDSDISLINERLDESFAEIPPVYSLTPGRTDSSWLNWGLQDATLLHIACRAGLGYYVKHLLQRTEIDIEARDSDSNTAIYYGATSGSAESVQALLDHGAEPDAEQYQGYKALHEAASKNHAETVKILLTAGVDPLTRKTKETPGRRCGRARRTAGATPLMYACKNGHAETIAEFLPFLKNAEDLEKALFWAAEAGQAKAVRVLLRQPTLDVNAKYEGSTALFKACRKPDLETVRELLQAGANPNLICVTRSRNGSMIHDPDNFRGEGASEQRPRGKTALHVLCENSSGRSPADSECLSLLIAAGADINAKTAGGSTALHIACRTNAKLVKLLLEAGADPSAEDGMGRTVLHTNGEGDEDILPLLLDTGLLDVNKPNSLDGKTPLHFRLADGFRGTVLSFLQYKPDLNAVDFEGNTALHLVVGSYGDDGLRSERIDALLAAGANPNIKNRKGNTPLHETRNYKDQLEKLIMAGAEIEARNHKGETPLFISTYATSRSIDDAAYQYLIDSGARLDTRDFRGQTLLFQCLDSDDRFDYLVDLGLDPKATDYQGCSLLFKAVGDHEPLGSHDPVSVTKRLVSMGLNIDQPDNSGRTVLHKICSRAAIGRYQPRRKHIDYILSICEDLNTRDVDGIQPLHLAAATSINYVSQLLEAGANLFGLTHEGMSILHIAARTRQSDIVCLILSKLQDISDTSRHSFINKQDRSGKSALHYASRSGRPETVKMLLKAGADPNMRDAKKLTPFQHAARFEAEQEMWKNDFLHSSPSVLNAAGILLEDERRPFFDKDPYLSEKKPPMQLEIENQTTRLEEILELLFKFGARQLTGAKGCLRRAFDYALSKEFDYTVVALMNFQKRFIEEDAVIKPDGGFDFLVCEGRWEATKKGLKDSESFYNPERTFQRISKRALPDFSEQLLIMRHYDVLGEMLSECPVSEATAPTQVSPTRINKQAKSCLHLLVHWGYKDLLARVCTPEMALCFDDHEWCARAGEAAKYGSERVQPLLRAACSRLLPNMEVLKFLVDEMKVNINVKQSFRSEVDDGSFEIKFDEGVLHDLANGRSWWHVEKAIPYLIERGANLEIRDSNGRTPLHVALNRGPLSGSFHRQAARTFIENGANVNACDYNHESCLGVAGSDVEMTKLLLSHGAEVNTKTLQSVIHLRQVEALEVLLPHFYKPAGNSATQLGLEGIHETNKALIEKRDSDVLLLLEVAFLSKDYGEKEEDLLIAQTRMFKLLLEHGVNPYAALHGESKLMEESLADGWNVTEWEFDNLQDLQDKRGSRPIIHHILERGKMSEPFFQLPSLDLEFLDDRGCTLLLAASKKEETLSRTIENSRGHPIACKTILEELLDRGANTTAQDNKGRTALHRMINFTDGDKFADAMRSIILRNRDIVHIQDRNGDTPLHYALRNWSVPFINLLLEYGADMLGPDSDGNTALHHLAGRFNTYAGDQAKELFQKFLETGVDINSQNKKGETAVFRYIIDLVFDHNFTEEEDSTSGSEFTDPYFDLFLEAGADFFIRSEGGTSLLHLLASSSAGSFRSPEKHVLRFKLLMDMGLDPMLEDSRQRTSLDIASACGREDILKLFERKPLY